MKQTAIEWLVEKIQQAKPTFKFDSLIREAKAMEKQQIIASVNDTCDAKQDYFEGNNEHDAMRGEQYYIEIYGK